MNDERLMTLAELAAYCGRSYAWLRECYADGLLPDPKATKRHKKKTMRHFSRHEADAIRLMFASEDPNKWKEQRRRMMMQKALREGANEQAR